MCGGACTELTHGVARVASENSHSSATWRISSGVSLGDLWLGSAGSRCALPLGRHRSLPGQVSQCFYLTPPLLTLLLGLGHSARTEADAERQPRETKPRRRRWWFWVRQVVTPEQHPPALLRSTAH